MADNENSIIKLDGIEEVGVKFLEMLEKACVFVVSPHGKRKDFHEAVESYKKSINNNKELDPLAKAAMIASAKKDLKEYINKSNIIMHAIEQLDEDASFDVDEDWLDYFFEYAKNISDEAVQRIWGRILAEKAYEGTDSSIQRQLIHVLSLMDTSTAMAFTNLCRITIKYPSELEIVSNSQDSRFYESRYIPLVIHEIANIAYQTDFDGAEYKRYSSCIPSNKQLSALKEIGLIQYTDDPDKHYYYPFSSKLTKIIKKGVITDINDIDDIRVVGIDNLVELDGYVIEYHGSKYKLFPKNILSIINKPLPANIKTGSVKFTTIGEKLYQLIVVEPLDGFEDIFIRHFKGLNLTVETWPNNNNNSDS